MKFLTISLFALLISLSVSVANAADIADDRLVLTPSGSIRAIKRVEFGGQTAQIDGNQVVFSSSALYSGSETIFDAVSKGGVDYILAVGSITIRFGKKINSIKLGSPYTDGKLLFVTPTYLIYYLTGDGQTLFWTQSLTSRRIVHSEKDDFVSASLDAFGNFVVASKTTIISVNKQGQIVPIFKTDGHTLTSFDVDPTDSGLLFCTEKGLFKIARNRKVYTLIRGSGLVERVGTQIYWKDNSDATRYQIAGLKNVGDLASDKQYAATLIDQAQKLHGLGLDEKAFAKYLKVMELMPNEPNVKAMVLKLGKKLFGKPAQ